MSEQEIIEELKEENAFLKEMVRVMDKLLLEYTPHNEEEIRSKIKGYLDNKQNERN